MRNRFVDKKSSNFLVLLSTLNLVLILFGYQFVATIFSPIMTNSSGTQFITIPYRIITLGISLFLIVRCHFKQTKSAIISLLWLYWLIIIVRLVIDFYIQSSLYINPEGKSRIVFYIFCITLPSIIAYYKTWNIIDYNKALYLSVTFLIIIAIVNLVFNRSLFDETLNGRIEGGTALNTISFGHIGASMALISVYFICFRKNYKLKFLFWILLPLGIFIMIRSGSRGPLLTFLLIAILIFSFRTKQFFFTILSIGLLLLLIFLFKNALLDLINDISPVLHRRLISTIDKGDLSGRDVIYNEVINSWLNNPFIGTQFTYYYKHFPVYSHNLVLDAALQGGIVGIIIMLTFYFQSTKALYYSVENHKDKLWLTILILQNYIAGLSSSSFYQNSILSVGIIAIIFLRLNSNKDILLKRSN